MPNDANSPNFGRSKVYYGCNELADSIKNLATIIEDDLVKNDAFGNSENAVKVRLQISQYFLATLLPYLTSIKHEAYGEEQEYRIYTLLDKSSRKQKFFTAGDSIEAPHISSKKRVYFKFDIQNVSEIWIGPRLNFDHASSSIEQIFSLLASQGHDTSKIKICRSGIPYKNSSY